MKNKLRIIISIVLIFAVAVMASGFSAVSISKISIDKTSISLKVGKTYSLKVTISPSNATNKKLAFSSGNKNIATVDKNGKIKAIKAGNTIITVTSSSNKKISAKCKITVFAGVKTYKFTYVMWGYQDQFVGAKKPKYFDDVAAEINKRLEKEKGFRLDFNPIGYPADSFADKLNLELASGREIDAVKNGGANFFDTYGDKNLAVDLTDYIAKYGQNIKRWYPQNVWDEFTKAGKTYAIPQVDFPFTYAGWMRTDWLNKAGLKMPTTIAELENIFKKFRDGDFDGNGKNDTVPLQGACTFLVNFFLGAFTSHPADYIEGNVVKSVYEDPGYKQVLLMLQKWYKEKYIDDTIFDEGGSANISSDLFSKDKLFMELTNVFNLEWGPLNAVYKARPEMKFHFVPTMNDVKKFPAAYGIAGLYLFIPSSSKIPDIVIQYYDWIYKSEDNYVLVYPMLGIKGKTFVLDENNAPDLPKAELDSGVKPGTLLSGPYSNVALIQYNLKYLPAATPPETRQAYDWVKNLDLSAAYVPATKTLGISLPENLKVKASDSEKIKSEYVQKVITGKATYEEFISKWKAAGGEEVYAQYTKAYQTKKK